jgi:hypothetical protein
VWLHLFGDDTVVEAFGYACVPGDGGLFAVELCVRIEEMVGHTDRRHQAWVMAKFFIEVSEECDGFVIGDELLDFAVRVVNTLLPWLWVGNARQAQEAILLRVYSRCASAV